MSLLDVLNTPTDPNSEHEPIIWLKASHITLNGFSWHEWGCGCTCGWLDKGPGFIAAESSARRIYQRHLDSVLGSMRVLSNDPQTERDNRFALGNDLVWGAGNWIRCSICPLDAEDNQVYHHKDMHK